MPTHTCSNSPTPPPARHAHLAETLAAGGPIIVPGEGVYVLAAPARSETAGLLASPTWLAPDAETLAAALPPGATAVHRRLVRRLAPGPAMFAMDGAWATPAPVGITLARTSSDPEVIHLIVHAGSPVVGVELMGTDGSPADSPVLAVKAANVLGIRVEAAAVLDTAPVGRQLATIIQLLPVGGVGGGVEPFRIVRAGAYEERFIRKQLGLNVLFVCTGNTCRSPMAAAIASGLVSRTRVGGLDVHFSSAGTAAAAGGGATPEGIAAVRALGLGGGAGSMSGHHPRPLTRRMIAEADSIYTMGRSHLHAVLELDPGAEGKVRLLDPDGADVPDPVGGPQDVYTQTARRIMGMLERRLKELGT